MKEKVIILFNFKRSKWPLAKKFFKAIGRFDLAEGEEKEFGYTFEFYDNDPKLNEFFNNFKRFKVDKDPFIRRERIYTPKELESCKLLTFGINRAPKGYGAATYGTKFDLTKACKKCGTGALQKSHLILKSSEIPKNKDAIHTLDGEIIVSEKIKNLLRKFKGLELRQISFVGHKIKPKLYQIIPKIKLPPMSKNSKGIMIEDQCKSCCRGGHFSMSEAPFEPHYDTLDERLLNKSDIFLSYEYFGNSIIKEKFSDSVFADQLIIVKPSIMKAFKDLKIKETGFGPVIVNGYPNIDEWRKNENK